MSGQVQPNPCIELDASSSKVPHQPTTLAKCHVSNTMLAAMLATTWSTTGLIRSEGWGVVCSFWSHLNSKLRSVFSYALIKWELHNDKNGLEGWWSEVRIWPNWRSRRFSWLLESSGLGISILSLVCTLVARGSFKCQEWVCYLMG